MKYTMVNRFWTGLTFRYASRCQSRIAQFLQAWVVKAVLPGFKNENGVLMVKQIILIFLDFYAMCGSVCKKSTLKENQGRLEGAVTRYFPRIPCF